MVISNHIEYTLDRVGPCFKYNLLYININSLLNKLCDLEILIEQHRKIGIVIHFIALTEVRLDDDTCIYFNIDGYNAFFCNKQMNSGGVALFCLDTMVCSPLMRMNISGVDILGVSVANVNISLLVVYKQPTVSSAIFLPIMDCILDKYHKCIIVGDLNVDLLKNNT